MKNFYALVGKNTGDLLSYEGKVLIHWDREELEFLIPGPAVRQLNSPPKNWMHISEHPQLKGVVEFPLDKSEFRTRSKTNA